MSPRELLLRYTGQEITDYVALQQIYESEEKKRQAKHDAEGKTKKPARRARRRR